LSLSSLFCHPMFASKAGVYPQTWKGLAGHTTQLITTFPKLQRKKLYNIGLRSMLDLLDSW